VRGADGTRGDTVPFRNPPARVQVPEDFRERGSATNGEEPGDVLDEEEPRSDLAGDLPDEGPEPSVVVDPGALSGDRCGLAREARHHEIHHATERAAVEGLEIVPYKKRIQGASLHLICDSGNREGLPLDRHHKATSGHNKPDSQLGTEEASAESGAGGGAT
jgi:hypothetical protein